MSARTLGLQKPYTVLRYTAALLIAFGWVFRPISRLLVRVGNAVTPGKGFKKAPSPPTLSSRSSSPSRNNEVPLKTTNAR
ncbi:MAG: hypothetical protein U1U88_002229 [Lawsonella clevelandensis]